ncbi:unnamed protein product [Adineta ricciae]|uniref:Uncharacterized protein n=1 Tax=Adineta ricciae TaxID=249248 RepID=A0A816A5T3_ADIRI|nr:unnamed protein product [Adineta ricciae]
MNVYNVNTFVLLFVSVLNFVQITSEQVELNRAFNLSPEMRIFSLTNTSTTTCTTVPQTKTTTSTSTTNHSLGYLGRRLLNEPSYDTDLDISSQHQHLLQADNEINEFLQVNEEDMFKALQNVELTTDGSGETTYSTAEYSSDSTFVTTTASSSEAVTTQMNHSITSVATSQTFTSIITTTTTTMTITVTDLPNVTTFLLILNCSNAGETLKEIVTNFTSSFTYPIIHINFTLNSLYYRISTEANATITIITDKNVTILNEVYRVLRNIATHMGVSLYGTNTCGMEGFTTEVQTVTSCFLIDTCNLCGANPPRGVCDPKQNVSKCRCFTNEEDPSSLYQGDFCTKSSVSKVPSSRSTPIVIGILAGLSGLLLIITIYLIVITFLQRRRRLRQQAIKTSLRQQAQHSRHLPRIQPPASLTPDQVSHYVESITPTSNTHQTNQDNPEMDSISSQFYRELDRQLIEQSPTTTSPSTRSIRAFDIASDTLSSLDSYDPIYELDAILDNEGIYIELNQQTQSQENEQYF